VSVDVVVRVDGSGAPSAGGATPTPPDAGRAVGGDRAVRRRAWGDALLEDQMVREGFVSIGGDEVGDMSEWPGRDTLAAALPDRDPQAIQLFCTYWDRFVRFLRVGDLVVVPSSKARTVAVGEITGGYEHHPVDSDPRTHHRRPVHWLATAVNRDDLPADIRRAVNAPGTIGAIKVPDAASRLRALAPR
jgi:predicted Mrr-cat superfamily restriction endonuclease